MGELDDYKPVMAMVGLQVTYAGLYLLTRTALLEGMSPRVFVVYRQAIATLIIAPIAYFTRSVIFLVLFSSLFFLRFFVFFDKGVRLGFTNLLYKIV